MVGPGDDAAVISAADGRVVATTDLLIENRHFRRDWSSATDVGRKAAATNFSDIAAMGARPTALLVGFGTPPDLNLAWVDDLTAGLREECGGDLEGRDPVLLDGARPGDVVAFVGRLGYAAAGYAILSRGFRSPVQLVNAHRRPEPPYAQGPAAADQGASAMTDVSDGLVADLGHIAEASGVRIDIHAGAVPVPLKMREVGAALNVDPLSWVLAQTS